MSAIRTSDRAVRGAVRDTDGSLPVRIVRRLIDVVVSAAMLVVTSPLLAVAVLAIRLESPGPALFRQTRLGQHRKPFTIYKLRGMYIDAPQRWAELYDYDGLDDTAAAELRFHQERDPRVTRVGRFLRRTSIDELPNFINVLKGDMHLVGPRPEIPELAPYYVGEAARILEAKPGLTSLPKATGRDSLTFAETVALDLRYLDERSLRTDIKVLAMTAVTVLGQRHVHPGG
jgi:lipopolysaccharide/colanic/teichoic acid biosynthesis glycosyltransferase